MQNNGEVNKSVLNSGTKSQMLAEVVTSENLPRSVSMKLYELMTKVVSDDVNPKTVNAACACASEIHKILKLNLEIKRQGL